MRSDLGARLIRAEAEGRVRREFRFSLLCPAADFFPDAPQEDVLLQGVVDCCFEEDGKLVIVDYKTDRIGPDGVQARTDYYASQLRAYAGAMERILGLPAKQRLLFFLHGGYVSEI
jgi:ATP-dependent helicase/nuclease subunit A